MVRPRSLLLLTLPLLLLGAARASAAPRPRDAAFEARILSELEAKAPEARPIFEEATMALDANDPRKAAELYEKVIEMAPGFSHAERRECSALLTRGDRAAALPFCRAALGHEASPENQASLAATLVTTNGFAPSASEVEEAKRLAQSAAAAKPDEAYVWQVSFRAAMAAGDRDAMKRSADRLAKVAPDDPGTDFVAMQLALVDQDADGAHAALDRAKSHGLPEADAAKLRAIIDTATAKPWWLRVALFLGKSVMAWLLALGVLLAAGYALSRATLREVTRLPTEAHARPSERALRRIYRALLVAAGAFYYASLPLLVVVVVAAVLGVIGGILAAGWIAPKLFIILAIVGASSVYAILKGVFTRVKETDPGAVLDLDANPTLKAALDEVAARIGTGPVDRVFMTPFTDLAVFDRGSVVEQMRGTSRRCLVLGAGVLEGMSVRAFKSVLAHEYGHFRNEDTAGGGFALAVRRSLLTMAVHLARSGAASPINPAWWFVRGFGRAFLGISQGASRLQEVLADRWAAFAYGSSAFEEGLLHVVNRDVRFDAHLGATLDEVVKEKRALPNLYAFVPREGRAPEQLTKAVGELLEKAPSPYDSHPRPADRLAWVRALAAESPPAAPGDDAEAWSLFADRAALEAQMTAEVRDRVAERHNVRLAAA